MIILAKSAGFCFGVKRAVETLEVEAEKTKISTLGPIIHNGDVVKAFEDIGVYSYDNPADVPKDSKIAIRAHGVPKETIDDITARGYEYTDLTCPFVKKIHNIVAKAQSEGKQIVIIGDKNHPEVIGINGWCENNAIIALDISDISGKIDICEKVCLVCQTTMDRQTFEKISQFVNDELSSFW